MKIHTKASLASALMLAVIGLIAAVTWWAQGEVGKANARRERTDALELGLTDLRLVTFEYVMSRAERPREQWLAVSGRLDRLIAGSAVPAAADAEILAAMRERRASARGIFAELSAAPEAGRPAGPDAETTRRFEAQLISRLLTLQQESYADAQRLGSSAGQRIEHAEHRARTVTFSGLVLIALIVGGAHLFLRRDVLAPIVRLQKATAAIAAGDLGTRLAERRSDEIGELAHTFNAMAASLRDSFTGLEAKNRDLTALNRELEAFAYSVSHDLRTPLRALDGFSSVLLEDYGGRLDAAGRDALQRIRAASQRMGRLIDDLLNLSRVTRTELRLAEFDLSAAAREIADSLQQSQPSRKVRCEIAEHLRIQADPALLGIALRNLLDNAWKFTGKTAQPVIRVGARVNGGTTEYFVADNGAGFDMGHTGQLFGAFQRLHHAEEFPGTGIGLAIAQRVVQRHGGRIWAEAKAGGGATFFFTLGRAA